INPESGYFGVAPGTNGKTNANAMAAVSRDSIFTNVAMTDDRGVWWEGMDGPVPSRLTDWQGNPWTPSTGTKAAHPNSRFTTPATNNPALSSHWEDPQGVPISAILFGGRRARTVPLVYKAFDWDHGVFIGATMASETTAAATGAVGVVRRDPMAMLPFCGYNMGDYWAHWLNVGQKASNPPAIFQVNWFRTDDEGHYIWPGFGENMRVLRWVRDQALSTTRNGHVDSRETPIGIVPTPEAVGASDLGLSRQNAETLFAIDRDDWLREAEDQGEFLRKFGDRLPPAIRRQHQALQQRLSPVTV
ncbi:MAG: phosphoenolpyruvate carboxykinase (GTP), partial [Chloroflexi bacterium]|nr:phosphoenolpyruvate carboxykinase (GTP) [Chloroflexota bacterium]